MDQLGLSDAGPLELYASNRRIAVTCNPPASRSLSLLVRCLLVVLVVHVIVGICSPSKVSRVQAPGIITHKVSGSVLPISGRAISPPADERRQCNRSSGSSPVCHRCSELELELFRALVLLPHSLRDVSESGLPARVRHLGEGASGPLIARILWHQLNGPMQLVASPPSVAEDAAVTLAGSQVACVGHLHASPLLASPRLASSPAREQQGNELRDEERPLVTFE